MSPPAELTSDSELIARVLQGDKAEYAVLVTRYQERLYRFALGSTGDPDTAADMVQDTFVKAYTSLSTCRERERFGSWLFRILRNRCMDFQKEHRRRDVSLNENFDGISRLGSPDGDLARAGLRNALEQALLHLPDAQREAFLLKHVQDLSYEEIGSLLGVGASALKMRVARAREVLRTTMRELGYEHSRLL
ncbi:RNA polymerase sigma factor RpoE [soil metagenome]